MTKVTLPKIPKGNLGKVYVLSEKAAEEFFKESSTIVRERWPLPEMYTVPSREDVTVTLNSYPSVRFDGHPYGKNNEILEGSFGIAILYSHRNNVGDWGMNTGFGKNLLGFLCRVKWGTDGKTITDADGKDLTRYDNLVIVPNSHIFIYNFERRQEGITLPSESFKWGIVNKKTEEELNRQIKPALEDIVDKIESVAGRRGAILTRGFLSNRFII